MSDFLNFPLVDMQLLHVEQLKVVYEVTSLALPAALLPLPQQ